jgi:chitodextrinase
VNRPLANQGLLKFPAGSRLALCLVLFVTGCNSFSSSPPPPPDTAAPTAPASLVATAASDTQINLVWMASTDNVGVMGYKVERCQTAGCSNFAQIATPTAAAFNDTGLTPSTSYTYRVRATDAAGNLSSFSASSTATSSADTTPPSAPTSPMATAASPTQINLSWIASTDDVAVTGYRVERCQGAGCSNFAQVATPLATTFNDTGLTPSTSYSYRVRAVDAASNPSVPSTTATASTTAAPDTTPPSAPTNLTATAASATQINLAWIASTDNVGVTGYRVERCQGAGCSNFSQIATPVATTFNDTGLTASTSYSYRVRATDAANNLSTYSSTSTASTAAAPDTTPPSVPTSLTATAASTTQINLAWTASTDNVGVTGYRVERCQGAGCSNFAQIATPTAATFNDTGLTPSTSYSYRVRATDAAANLSAFSSTATASTMAAPDTMPPTSPSNLTAIAASSSQINLGWTASTDNVGVTGYRVERCQSAGCSNFVQIATPATTTFNDTGLTASTSYSYRVRAADAAGNLSGFSNTATATTSSSAPISVSISPKRAAIAIGQTQTYVATVSNDSQNLGVTWEVDTIPGGNATTLGTIDTNGKYTPPTSGIIGGAHTITAMSKADITKSANASVAVTDFAGVFTYHNDNSRAGTNQKEFGLTTSTVKTATFGKLFSCAVDSAIYAQPLWIPNLTFGAAKHNVIVVATERNSVYAFDADVSPCISLWQKNLIDAAHGGTVGETPVPSGQVGSGFGDLAPEVGITGTPVIDPNTNTIYVVSKSVNAGTFFQRLHAIDLLTGNEKFGPANIDSSIFVNGTGDGSAGGQVTFDVKHEHQRAALALVNGIVYVAWASHEDADPYHGWVLSFNASNLSLLNKFNDSPNGNRGGIWMAGGAPAADSSNNLYLITGNGDYDGTNDFGDSILKLSSTLTRLDSFTPSVQDQLNASDLDLGSGGAVVLIDLPAPAPADHQHLLIGGGKGAGFSGQLYSLDRTNLGQFNASDLGAKQIFAVGGGIFATPAFWQNSLYIAGTGTKLQAYSLNPATGVFTTTPASQSASTYSFPGATPSVSSSGATNGIIWAIDSHSYCTSQSNSCGPAVLHAYDAANLATELWNSSQVAGDKAGNAVKFTVATVANGKVYIGTRGSDTTNGGIGELDVYGLKPN